MKVWMRPRLACRIASPARSMSSIAAGEAADRALDDLGDFRDGLEVAVGGGREAGLDHVDAHLVQELRDSIFSSTSWGAGRLLAVAHGGVEDQYAILFRSRGGGVRSFGVRKIGHNLRFLA